MKYLMRYCLTLNLALPTLGTLGILSLVILGLIAQTTMNSAYAGSKQSAYPKALPLSNHDCLLIKGKVKTNAAQLVVRVDDRQSYDFFTRMNRELSLAEGPFSKSIPVDSFSTEQGNPISADNIRQVIVFASPRNSIDIAPLEKTACNRSTLNSLLALDFGGDHSSLQAGFERVSKETIHNHFKVSGTRIKSIKRLRADSLSGDGLTGVEQIQFKVSKAGWYQINLWQQQPSAWEWTPHWQQKRLQLNGKTLWFKNRVPKDWITSYSQPDWPNEQQSLWRKFGAKPQQFVVELAEGWHRLDFAGTGAGSLFVAGLLISDLKQANDEIAQVQQNQQQQFSDFHPSQSNAVQSNKEQNNKELNDREQSKVEQQPTRLSTSLSQALTLQADKQVMAGNQQLFLHFVLDNPAQLNELSVIEPTLLQAASSIKPLSAAMRTASKLVKNHKPIQTLTSQLWCALPYPSKQDGLVSYQPNHWTTDLSLCSTVQQTVHLLLQLSSSDKQSSGVYSGLVTTAAKQFPLRIEVLQTRLPNLKKGVGLYYELPPFLHWFDYSAKAKFDYFKQDLRWLASFDLNLLSLPFDLSRNIDHQVQNAQNVKATSQVDYYFAALTMLKQHGFNHAFDYTSIKRTTRPSSKQRINKYQGQQCFSAFDEGEHSRAGIKQASLYLAELKQTLPLVKLAGQINHPKQLALLNWLDCLLVNHGLDRHQSSLNLQQFKRWQQQGKQVWLYNLPSPYLAASWAMYRLNADNYIQWHARMPIGWPYNPTDGHESDHQYLMPRAPNQTMQSIHSQLIEMSIGIQTAKYLQWLQDCPHPQCHQLKQAIDNKLPTSWQALARIDSSLLNPLLRQIQMLAKSLQLPV